MVRILCLGVIMLIAVDAYARDATDPGGAGAIYRPIVEALSGTLTVSGSTVVADTKNYFMSGDTIDTLRMIDSGTISVANFPSTYTVTGTLTVDSITASLVISSISNIASGTVTIGNFPSQDTNVIVLDTVTITGSIFTDTKGYIQPFDTIYSLIDFPETFDVRNFPRQDTNVIVLDTVTITGDITSDTKGYLQPFDTIYSLITFPDTFDVRNFPPQDTNITVLNQDTRFVQQRTEQYLGYTLTGVPSGDTVTIDTDVEYLKIITDSDIYIGFGVPASSISSFIILAQQTESFPSLGQNVNYISVIAVHDTADVRILAGIRTP